MGALKGRPKRQRDGDHPLFARVSTDVIDRLDAGAAALHMSRAAYVERLLLEMPVDDEGLPPWLLIWRDEQLPLSTGKEPAQSAA
jgi:hypothetical protein